MKLHNQEMNKPIKLHPDLEERVRALGISDTIIDVENFLNKTILQAIKSYKTGKRNDAVYQNNENSKGIQSVYTSQAIYLAEEIALAYHCAQNNLQNGLITLLKSLAENPNGLFFPGENSISRDSKKRAALEAIILNLKKNQSKCSAQTYSFFPCLEQNFRILSGQTQFF